MSNYHENKLVSAHLTSMLKQNPYLTWIISYLLENNLGMKYIGSNIFKGGLCGGASINISPQNIFVKMLWWQ